MVDVDLIAHRGFAARHPENTRPAVRAAARRADAVEVDVRRCRTGEPVVVHDATLDRVTDTTGPVDERGPGELAALSVLGSGAGVPTLSTVLDDLAALDAGINVELKAPVWVALDRLRAADVAEDRVLVSSFDADTLRQVRERSAFDTAYLARSDDAVSTAADLGCTAVHPHHSLVDAAFVDRAHDHGLAVNAWTVTERTTADRLRAAGADGVIADHPDVR